MSSLGFRWVLWVACVTSSMIAACGGADSDIESGVRESLTVVSAAQARTQAPTQPQPPLSTNPTNRGTTATPTSPPTNACGIQDIGGWTIPTPVKADAAQLLHDIRQLGSRIHYVSPVTGNDATGQYYLWDGRRIIDSTGSATDASGRAYGTDPMNPSAAVKAFKRWTVVGALTGGGTVASALDLATLEPKTRKGYPDWWLFKRGETVDLYGDLASAAKERGFTFDKAYANLRVSGAKDPASVQVVGAYGDLCAPRPRFVHPQYGFVINNDKFANVAYLSLHFDGHDRPLATLRYDGLRLMYQTPESKNIVFEDVWFDAANVTISESNGAQLKIRRSLVTDNFQTDGSHVQGVFYSGSREGVLRIEESILLRNGFSYGDPKSVWPPSGKQKWDIYNRNLYISGQTNSALTGLFDSVSMIGASGDQFRPGARVERNFFYQGYLTMGAYGGYPDGDGPTGSVLDNILQRFVGSNTDDNRGQPGWGINLTSGVSGIEVARNIVSGAQYSGTSAALNMSPLGWMCVTHTFRYATRNNRIHSNIFESSAKYPAIEVVDGVKGEPTDGCSNWQFPGVRSNVAADNVLVTESGIGSRYSPVGAAINQPNDTVYTGNRLFATRAEASIMLGWKDPNRTLKTHLQSLAVNVVSADGFLEYYALAINQRRGQWRADLMSKAINNHIRAGFNMVPLE